MERIVHVTTFAESLGGMQAIVRRHGRLDATARFDPMRVTLFERGDDAATGEIALGANGGWTVGGLRRTFQARARPLLENRVAVYHNGWGLPLLAPGDGARRRLAYLHTHWPQFALAVRSMQPWCDGFVVISEDMRDNVRRLLPNFPAERIYLQPYPVDPPQGFSINLERDFDPRRFRIGVIGRVQIAQKRLDRLAALVRESVGKVPGAQWEVIGDGPALVDLRRELATLPVQFTGRLDGRAYWERLAGLDAVVFLSDFEGTPIALLEAMTCGALPLYPMIGGAAERYSRSVDEKCVYRAGEVGDAAESLAALAHRASRSWRQRAHAAVARHRAEDYDRGWIRIVHAVAGDERISGTETKRQRRWSDFLPLALVQRRFEAAIWR